MMAVGFHKDLYGRFSQQRHSAFGGLNKAQTSVPCRSVYSQSAVEISRWFENFLPLYPQTSKKRELSKLGLPVHERVKRRTWLMSPLCPSIGLNGENNVISTSFSRTLGSGSFLQTCGIRKRQQLAPRMSPDHAQCSMLSIQHHTCERLFVIL